MLPIRRKKYKKCLGTVNVVFVIDIVDVDDVAAAVSVSVFGVDDVDVDVPPAVVAVAVDVAKLIFFYFWQDLFSIHLVFAGIQLFSPPLRHSVSYTSGASITM